MYCKCIIYVYSKENLWLKLCLKILIGVIGSEFYNILFSGGVEGGEGD